MTDNTKATNSSAKTVECNTPWRGGSMTCAKPAGHAGLHLTIISTDEDGRISCAEWE